jgi:hypothetical protein
MSYWYDKKKEDLSISSDGKELDIYIGTEGDLPYPDCGNIYVSVPIEDVEEFIKEAKKKLKKLKAKKK